MNWILGVLIRGPLNFARVPERSARALRALGETELKQLLE